MDMRFLGIDISRKTDILAFAAFLLSLSSIAYQIFVFFAGPKVTLAKPRQVVVLMHPAPDTKERYLTFISTLAYVNSGQLGKNAVVMQEDVSFSLEGETYNYTWNQFGLLAFVSDSRKIKFDTSRAAGPFVVPAGGAEAHETLFAARKNEEFIDQKDIKRVFESALMGKKLIWKLRFNAETLNGDD